MPTLEVDGKVICHSYAIFRYLANELGLYGSSNMDKAIADQVAETINEMFTDVLQIMFVSKEPEEKKVLEWIIVNNSLFREIKQYTFFRKVLRTVVWGTLVML